MQTDSIELGFLSIFALITFFIFLITEKYSYKFGHGLLLDKVTNHRHFTVKQYLEVEELHASHL